MIGPALSGIIPVICVTLAGLACMLAEAFRQRGERMPIGGLGLVGLIGAGAAIVLLWGRRASTLDVVVADDFGLFVQFVLVGIGVLTIVFSSSVIERDGLPAGEYYALLLFGLAGMMLMAVATDLLVIFLALEVFSLALYVLTGLRRHAFASTEGAFKYFVLGGFSSAFFLYGIAFTYGLVGSTHLDRVAAAIQAQALTGNPLLLVATGSSASRSRWPPCRSTCGRRTRTKARQPSSRASCRRPSRRRPSPHSSACSSPRWNRCGASGRRSCGCWRSAR
jgi:NADH-quinone oxidoreductase subunit N